ncbi:E3 ubiquitin-protein ligase TRIM71-like [Saccostrea cucullata]|uniref:E3 ubiquitin-protein ligase TRIM71-like n=1 Tax=Saccostrea cuccullata TaxID=36930 RepID=UPI002ED40C91
MDPRTSAQDVIRCDLCKTAVVEMHCNTCLVNLCKACMGVHFSADLSKPHKIVDFKGRKSGPLYPKCKSHNKEPCVMYCKQCDIPVCINSLDSYQHLGHEVSKILQVEYEDEYGFSMETTQKSQEAGSSPPVKQLLDQPETVTTINTGYNYLYYVACLSDEEIWTSGLDKTMKLTASIRDHYSSQSQPSQGTHHLT